MPEQWEYFQTLEIKDSDSIDCTAKIKEEISFETIHGEKVWWFIDTETDYPVISNKENLHEESGSHYIKCAAGMAPNSDGNMLPPKQIRDNVKFNYDPDERVALAATERMLNSDPKEIFLLGQEQFMEIINSE